MGSVHLLHCSVLCTLPLTSGGVGIGLGGSRGLATSTRVVCRSWSPSSPTSLVSVPKFAEFFANFRFQLLQKICMSVILRISILD